MHRIIVPVIALMVPSCAQPPAVDSFILPEQRTITVRDVAELPRARIPETPPPPTVSDEVTDRPEWRLSLDEAIRTALENSEVIRVLTGVSATSSGVTVYDPAIANTRIDEERGRFDPDLKVNNSFNRFEPPLAVPDPSVAEGARIAGTRTDDYRLDLELSKTNLLGGTAGLGFNTNPSRLRPGIFPLDPQTNSALEMSYVQPLLRGGGIEPNVTPIVLARIETERSFFQLKDSVQELVRSVIAAYWSLVFARTDVWAREQQVAQGAFAYERESARFNRGLGELADVAQARSAVADFRAGLIAAKADQLRREATLLNILGLPPTYPRKPIPTTAPLLDRVKFDWNGVVGLAEQQRPDLIELKLIIEADRQQLLLAKNDALPNLDAVMLYRWNGLEGETPSGAHISSGAGQFTDWTLGVNFSVPLGLRQARAALRRQELIIARDRANLQQGLHNAIHMLAGTFRDLDQAYDQYEAFEESRAAALDNLNQQTSEYRAGRAIFLNVLQAINSWGNAVSAEAERLTQYNALLANLERETGTILETHGIRFFEERDRTVGPLGLFGDGACYPTAVEPGPNRVRYPSGDEPAENVFDLINPVDFSDVPRPPTPVPQPAPRKRSPQ